MKIKWQRAVSHRRTPVVANVSEGELAQVADLRGEAVQAAIVQAESLRRDGNPSQ